MKFRWLSAVLLFAAVIHIAVAQSPGGAAAKPLTPLEQSLMASDKAFGEAQKKKDIDSLKRMVTDDFVGVGTDGSVFDKNDLLENARMADMQEYRPYEVQILPMSDGTAVITYDCIVRMTLYDEPIPRYQHISSVWIKQGEQWRLKFQQATATR